MPILTAPGRLEVPAPHGLRHPPQLGQLDPERVEELQHLYRGRRRADVDTLDLVESEHRPDPREVLLVGLGDPGLELVGHRLAALAQPDTLERGRDRVLDRLALLLGLAGEHRLEPGLELLPDPRHGEEPRRVDLRAGR